MVVELIGSYLARFCQTHVVLLCLAVEGQRDGSEDGDVSEKIADERDFGKREVFP